MENGENTSAKSQAGTPTSLKTPNSLSPPGLNKKQVGFARTKPTLVIPPPAGFPSGKSPHSAQTIQSAPATGSNHVYNRKASVFMFDQFQGVKDFTKSGLGIGEKCAYCVYNKLKSWSKKWFTHMFLTIVLTLYTIGGALVFEFIEGRHETAVKAIDLRDNRDYFVGNVSKEWKRTQNGILINEWEAYVRKRLKDYEKTVIQYYQNDKLLAVNPEGKVWTFWNAIVYCGTICTTIEIMDTPQAPPDQQAEENDRKSAEKEIDVSRIEALVTPEQELSASVARRRRTFTKKRSKEREPTPVRQLDDKTTTTTEDEDAPLPKPKTPERRRRRRLPKSTGKSPSRSEPDLTEPEVERIRKGAKVQKSSSIPKQIVEEFEKRVSLADAAQAEVVAFFHKTKKSITAAANRGRDRFKKVDKEVVKRSQSAPHTFTEEELIESFRKAQLLAPNRAESTPKHVRKYSDSSLISYEKPSTPKQLRPEVIEFVRQRKKQRSTLSPANKIVEILDPKTSNIIATRRVMTSKPDFNLLHLFTVLRFHSIRELISNYKTHKVHMKAECDKIRKLRNRCVTKLLLIVIFCGLGGFLFKFVEGSFEFFYKCGVKRVKRDFIDLLWTKSHNMREEDWKSLARNKLKNFENELHTAHEAGVKTYSGQRSWSFLNAVLYCLTTITTIGYGHIYPTTVTGKALTIAYAIIGIPLFLLALTDFGKLFTRCIKFFWSFVRRVYYTGNCRRARKTAHVKEIFKGAQMMYEIATFRRPSTFVDPEAPPSPESSTGQIGDDTPTTPAISNFEIDDEFNLPISLAIFILVLYIFFGALIYCVWEQWDFFNSFYFVFISMSTVGFGDIVPDDPVCMIVSIVYLVFGLALMSMCINVVQLKLSDTFSRASNKIGATIGISVAEEDGSINTVAPEAVELPGIHETPENGGEASPSSLTEIDLTKRD